MKLIIKKHSFKKKPWIKKHFNDKFVKQAHKKKIRSRAWFKLQNIQKKDKIFLPGMTVLDLGSSPGSWSQYVIKKIGNKGNIIALDILPMKPIKGVKFVKGNLFDKTVFNKIISYIEKKKIDVLLSDIMHNMSGISFIDISKSIFVAEFIIDNFKDFLSPNGVFLIKILQGEGFIPLWKKINLIFKKVKIRKPNASRSRSKEIYIVAKGLNT